MNEPLHPLKDQRKTDSDQLTLLAVFHYVGAGLGLIGIAFLFVHYGIMKTVFSDPKVWQGQASHPPPAEMLAMFKWFYLAGGLVFIGYSVLNVISALSIQARKRRIFSMVVAGLNCVHVPIGTLLGVFTFIVLTRDTVRRLYDEKALGGPAATT